MKNKINKEKIYKEIIRELVKHFSPISVTVFGSFAKNKESESSDIDILIEKNTPLPILQRCREARRCLRNIEFPFDVLVYTNNELKERKKDKYSVVYRALREGKKIYEKKSGSLI